MVLSEDNYSIHLGMVVCLVFSFFGSLFICVVYLTFSDIRSFPYKLVFYLSLVDMMHAIGFFLPPMNKALCEIQAAITSYFSLSSVLWTGIIAFALYMAVVKERRDLESYELRFVLFANGLPLLALVPPLAKQLYGEAEGWCWITATGNGYLEGTMLRLATFYGPLWLTIAFNSFVYFKIIRNVKKDVNLLNSSTQVAHKLTQKLRMYPLILLFCYSLATINRIYDLIEPDNMNFWLAFFSGAVMSLNGLLNALVYGFTDTVSMRLKAWVQGSEDFDDERTAGSVNDDA